MGVPLDLQDIQSGFLTTSAFNSNNTLIEQALAKALDRTGSVDNAMEVDLDMGLNDLFNADRVLAKAVVIDGVTVNPTTSTSIEDFQVTTETGTEDLADALNGRAIKTEIVRQLDDMTSFQNVAAVNLVDNYQFSIIGYHPDSDVGGGTWYYDSTRSKNDHDGGTVRSPTVPWNGTQGTLADFLNGVGETDPGGTGVFVLIDEPTLYSFGAVLDGVIDDTKALRAYLQVKDVVPGFDGELRFTDTISLKLNSTFKGLKDKSSFPGYLTKYTFDPSVLPAESTVAVQFNTNHTDLQLADASGFPDAGLVQIGPMTDCEYYKYDSKSGNTLIGAITSRGWFGGTQGPAIVNPGVDNQADQNHVVGTEVVQVQNAFERLEDAGSYAGHFDGVWITHANLVTSPYSVGRGNAIYATEVGFNKIIRSTTMRGFERGIYIGRSYVTILDQPMAYFCNVVGQIDLGNGAQIIGGDSGQIGNTTAGITGNAWYWKGGSGGAITGGNHGNGGNNNPFITDGHNNLTIDGAYIEAAKNFNLLAKNGGSISWSGGYIKEGFYLGRLETGGRINISNVHTKDVTYASGFTIFDADNSGFAKVINHFDEDDDAYRPDIIVRLGKVTPLANPLTNLEQWAKPSQAHTKVLTSGVGAGVLQVRTDVATELTKGGALKINYMARSEWSSGASVECGTFLVAFSHRKTITTVIDVVKGTDVAKANTSTGTLTITAGATAPSGDPSGVETFNINFTATTNAGQDTNLVVWYEEMPADREQFTVSEL